MHERRTIGEIFINRFVLKKFNDFENRIINKYKELMGLSDDFIEVAIILFWINNIARRFRQTVINGNKQNSVWYEKSFLNVINVIETII